MCRSMYVCAFLSVFPSRRLNHESGMLTALVDRVDSGPERFLASLGFRARVCVHVCMQLAHARVCGWVKCTWMLVSSC